MITASRLTGDGEQTCEDQLGRVSARGKYIYWMDFPGLSIPIEQAGGVRRVIEVILNDYREEPKPKSEVAP